MATKKTLTLTVASLSKDLDAEAFLHILASTVRALREINRELSRHGGATVEWKITQLGMSSPAFATLRGVGTASSDAEYGEQVVKAFVSGLRKLSNDDEPPPRFNTEALRQVAKVQQAFARGIAKVQFSNNGKPVDATKTVATNANAAIHKLELEEAKKAGHYVEFGEIEGRLKDLSEQSDRDKIVIVDDLTGENVSCFFRGGEVDQQVRDGWKHRVAVIGDIKYDRATRQPIEVRVSNVRRLRERHELPQIDDLLGFDITGGMDSVEYVRGLRDAD